MSTGINRFALSIFYCDDFSSKRRVMKEVRREKLWREQIDEGFVPKKPRRVGLRGKEMAAYFYIVNVERNPAVFLVGFPVAVALYVFAAIQIVMR